MNHLYQISDGHKHGCVGFTEFLFTYCKYERKMTHSLVEEAVKDLSAKKLNDLRKEFYDSAKKR